MTWVTSSLCSSSYTISHYIPSHDAILTWHPSRPRGLFTAPPFSLYGPRGDGWLGVYGGGRGGRDSAQPRGKGSKEVDVVTWQYTAEKPMSVQRHYYHTVTTHSIHPRSHSTNQSYHHQHSSTTPKIYLHTHHYHYWLTIQIATEREDRHHETVFNISAGIAACGMPSGRGVHIVSHHRHLVPPRQREGIVRVSSEQCRGGLECRGGLDMREDVFCGVFGGGGVEKLTSKMGLSLSTGFW